MSTTTILFYYILSNFFDFICNHCTNNMYYTLTAVTKKSPIQAIQPINFRLLRPYYSHNIKQSINNSTKLYFIKYIDLP